MCALTARAPRKCRTIARLLGTPGLRSLLGGICRWSGILCLNYHRIGDAGESVFDRDLWSATEEAFDAQVAFLKSNFDVVRPDDLPETFGRIQGRCVLITFDDGYRDNYAAAFPILRRHRVPATFFIATGFLDRPRLPWWDEIAWMARTSTRPRLELPAWLPAAVEFDEPARDRAVQLLLRRFKDMPSESTESYLDDLGTAAGTGRHNPADALSTWMTWDMVREMKKAGMTIGGHTVSHPVLANTSRREQQREIEGCGRRLLEELGEPMRFFSYPVGRPPAFNRDTRDCLREAGVQYAFSYYGGFRSAGDWDDYDVRRIAVENYITRDWFRAIVQFPLWFT
jgi:peptidoglycan/xylan/chitin deacetylase (PgdA/CDA1 family)